MAIFPTVPLISVLPLMVLMQSAEMHAAGDSCVIAALQRMEAANKGMLREGIIHVIA